MNTVTKQHEESGCTDYLQHNWESCPMNCAPARNTTDKKRNEWWNTHNDNSIDLNLANRLTRRNSRFWDCLLFNRDSITNPRLTLLVGLDLGYEALQVLRLYDNRAQFEKENP